MLQQLAVQHSVTQDYVAPESRRTAVIQHHLRLRARAQHAMNFPHRAGCVGRVMQYTVRIDDIEALIGKRKALAVGNRKVAARSVNREVLS